MSKKLKNTIKSLVFVAVVLMIATWTTYLFRGAETFGRKNIVGIKNEPRNSLKVVFVGSSSVYRYWDTMKAYHDFGIVSYDYSTSGMTGAGIVSAIKDIEKTQNPELIVVEVRSLLSRFEADEFGRDTRNIFDAQDISFERLKAIDYFRNLYNLPYSDALSEYFEIIQYHDNYDALKDPDHWKLIDNRINRDSVDENNFKGFVLAARYGFVEEPKESVFSKKTQEISLQSKKILEDLIEYCSEKDFQILLVASPFAINRRDEEQINYIEDMANEHGVEIIDTNKCYEEMGLDFSCDFSDVEHVNNFGSDKYTTFLSDYIIKKYDISVTHNNVIYDEEYERYTILKKQIDDMTLGLMNEKDN